MLCLLLVPLLDLLLSRCVGVLFFQLLVFPLLLLLEFLPFLFLLRQLLFLLLLIFLVQLRAACIRSVGFCSRWKVGRMDWGTGSRNWEGAAALALQSRHA